MASEETFTGSILFVDDSRHIRDVFTLVAESAGINVEIFEDPAGVEARLKTTDRAIEAVISDGLHGGWRQVITAAKEARVPAAVLSTDDSIQDEVEFRGAKFYPKEQLSRRLLLNILAEIKPPSDDL